MSSGTSFAVIQKQSVVFAAVCILAFLVLLALFDLGGIDDAVLTHRQLAARTRGAGTSMEWGFGVSLVVLGTAIGLAGGMLGMGGGAILVAGLLLLFKMDIFFARVVSMETMCLATASAGWHHIRKGTLPRKLIWPMVVPALVGTVGGVALGFLLRGSTLTYVFGFFMLFLGFFTLALLAADPLEELLRREFEKRPSPRHSRLVRGAGLVHGFLCGLLGISGGVITIPLQQMVLRVPARQAIAVSLVISAICTFAGSVVAISVGVYRDDFDLELLVPVLLCVGLGATIGAQAGARICGRVNSAVLRLLFVVVCVGAGLAILL